MSPHLQQAQSVEELLARENAIKADISADTQELAAIEAGDHEAADGTPRQWKAAMRAVQARIDASKATLATTRAAIAEASKLAEERRAAVGLHCWSHAASEARTLAKRENAAGEAAIDSLRVLLREEIQRSGYPSTERSGQLCKIAESMPERNYGLRPDPRIVADARGVWCIMIDMYTNDPSNPLSYDEAVEARDVVVRSRRASSAAE
jgi:hypothetical protein